MGSYVDPHSPWHNEHLKPREFNLTKAAEILTDAGYVDRDGDGLRESPDGIKLDFTLNVVSTLQEEGVRAGEMCKTWWRQIGVKIDLVVTEPGTLFSMIWGETGHDYDFDMFIWLWSSRSPDPVDILSYLTEEQIGFNSDTGWNNTEYNQLWKEQMHAKTDEERKQIIDRMQEIIYEEDPYIILHYIDNLVGYRCDRWEVPTDVSVTTTDTYLFSILTVSDVTPVGRTVVEKPGPIIAPEWLIAGVVIAIAVIAVAYIYKRRRE